MPSFYKMTGGRQFYESMFASFTKSTRGCQYMRFAYLQTFSFTKSTRGCQYMRFAYLQRFSTYQCTVNRALVDVVLANNINFKRNGITVKNSPTFSLSYTFFSTHGKEDPYSTLGVSRSATAQEIKMAYYKQVTAVNVDVGCFSFSFLTHIEYRQKNAIQI